MAFLTLLAEAYQSLLTARLRSFLAVLGIMMGTASVVAMVSIGQLATAEALAQFKTLGTDLFSITLHQSNDALRQETSSTPTGLDLSTAMALKQLSPNIIEVAPYMMSYLPRTFTGETSFGEVIGVTASFQRVAQLTMAQGRFISAFDGYNYFTVLGHDLAKKFEKNSTQDLLGQQILLRETLFTVIGILAPWPENNFITANINQAALVPASVIPLLNDRAEINNVLLKLTEHADLAQLEDQSRAFLQARVPERQAAFQNAKQLINSMRQQNDIFTLYLGLIGGISLLVGGIGVMNIMLVSVVERRREIGIRKAIGAKNWDIQALFLVESVALSLFGGLAGVSLGVIASLVVAIIAGWSFQWFFLPPVIGFLVSAAVGVFFGFYPAFQASRLDPIATLRSD